MTLFDLGLPYDFNLGDGVIINAHEYHCANQATESEVQRLLGLGPDALVHNDCYIFEDGGEERRIAVGIWQVPERLCVGHYTDDFKILPLHWGLNSVSQTASLLVKYARMEEESLPQAVRIERGSGTDFVYPEQTLVHVAIITRWRRASVTAEVYSYRNREQIMSGEIVLSMDIAIPHKPANASWKQVIQEQEAKGV